MQGRCLGKNFLVSLEFRGFCIDVLCVFDVDRVPVSYVGAGDPLFLRNEVLELL